MSALLVLNNLQDALPFVCQNTILNVEVAIDNGLLLVSFKIFAILYHFAIDAKGNDLVP